MLLLFGLGAIVIILITIAALKLTMREEPSGCLLAFGSMFFLLILMGIIMMWS